MSLQLVQELQVSSGTLIKKLPLSEQKHETLAEKKIAVLLGQLCILQGSIWKLQAGGCILVPFPAFQVGEDYKDRKQNWGMEREGEVVGRHRGLWEVRPFALPWCLSGLTVHQLVQDLLLTHLVFVCGEKGGGEMGPHNSPG